VGGGANGVGREASSRVVGFSHSAASDCISPILELLHSFEQKLLNADLTPVHF
jgi:hypothetical protein